MAFPLVDTFPQNITPVVTTTIHQLIDVLPETLAYPISVLVSGKIARYGITTGNLIFLTEGVGDPPAEMMQYFNSLVASLNIQATLSYNWRNNADIPRHLYNEGRLIIDKNTMAYTEVPKPMTVAPIFTGQDLRDKSPKTIPWLDTIMVTGGLLTANWSANDVDMFIEGEKDTVKLAAIRDFFTQAYGWKVQVGNKELPDIMPIRAAYKFVLYKDGQCQLQ